jgi:hypothetical protein
MTPRPVKTHYPPLRIHCVYEPKSVPHSVGLPSDPGLRPMILSSLSCFAQIYVSETVYFPSF